MIKLMAEDVKRRNVSKLRDNIYFGVSADETTDNQNNSIFSTIHRTVNDKLEAEEVFSGMHVVPNKKSETLSDTLVASILSHAWPLSNYFHFYYFTQNAMENIDNLNPHNNLVAQGYDGSNNMLGAKTGVAVRLRKKYPMAIENHCMCHAAALPCKKIFNNIDHMNNFQQHSFEIINLIKLSPHRENFLESYKKTAPPDKMNA